ncbi:MAG TPA: DUF5678 domain-containing protein [Blastocatellia bacterium]|nr:DUF5678 domain-containing protein [Blastocatellia bacterium]
MDIRTETAVATSDLERIIREVRQLPAEEKRRVREALDRDDPGSVRQTGRTVDLTSELRWIDEHRSEYAGQWVAVRGNRLLSHGPDPIEVYQAARGAGDDRPFVTRVESAREPFAGW